MIITCPALDGQLVSQPLKQARLHTQITHSILPRRHIFYCHVSDEQASEQTDSIVLSLMGRITERAVNVEELKNTITSIW